LRFFHLTVVGVAQDVTEATKHDRAVAAAAAVRFKCERYNIAFHHDKYFYCTGTVLQS